MKFIGDLLYAILGIMAILAIPAIVCSILAYNNYMTKIPLEIYSESETIENVTRIMMHEKDDYTIFVQVGDQLHTKRLKVNHSDPYSRLYVEPKFFTDAPKKSNMSVVIRTYKTKYCPSWYCKTFEFHVHNPQDIHGGPWEKIIYEFRQIKTIHGQTGVIE